ncbi:MAG: DUF542 domain-containing protein [Gemmatimonadaceae bacterium]
MKDSLACACSTGAINGDCTIDAVIARHPASIHVLNAYGVDTCCGGAQTIQEAALHIHVDPSELLASIERAAQP